MPSIHVRTHIHVYVHTNRIDMQHLNAALLLIALLVVGYIVRTGLRLYIYKCVMGHYPSMHVALSLPSWVSERIMRTYSRMLHVCRTIKGYFTHADVTTPFNRDMRRVRLFCSRCLSYLLSLPVTKGRKVTKVATPKAWRITIQKLVSKGYPHYVARQMVHMDSNQCLCVRCHRPIFSPTATLTTTPATPADHPMWDALDSYLDGANHHDYSEQAAEDNASYQEELASQFEDLDREDREREEALRRAEREYESCAECCGPEDGHDSDDRHCKYSMIHDNDIHYGSTSESCEDCHCMMAWIELYGHDHGCPSTPWACNWCYQEHNGHFEYCPDLPPNEYVMEGTVSSTEQDDEGPQIRKRATQVKGALSKTERTYANPVYEIDPPSNISPEVADKVLLDHNRKGVAWKTMTPARAQRVLDLASQEVRYAVSIYRNLPDSRWALAAVQTAQLRVKAAQLQVDRIAGRKEKR